MIRHKCPSCGAKLKSPEELAGREGRCPTCLGVVPIPEQAMAVDYLAGGSRAELGSLALSEDSGPLAKPVADAFSPNTGLTLKAPEHLGRYNHYLIVSSKDVVASWENDEKGWMVR